MVHIATRRSACKSMDLNAPSAPPHHHQKRYDLTITGLSFTKPFRPASSRSSPPYYKSSVNSNNSDLNGVGDLKRVSSYGSGGESAPSPDSTACDFPVQQIDVVGDWDVPQSSPILLSAPCTDQRHASNDDDDDDCVIITDSPRTIAKRNLVHKRKEHLLSIFKRIEAFKREATLLNALQLRHHTQQQADLLTAHANTYFTSATTNRSALPHLHRSHRNADAPDSRYRFKSEARKDSFVGTVAQLRHDFSILDRLVNDKSRLPTLNLSQTVSDADSDDKYRPCNEYNPSSVVHLKYACLRANLRAKYEWLKIKQADLDEKIESIQFKLEKESSRSYDDLVKINQPKSVPIIETRSINRAVPKIESISSHLTPAEYRSNLVALDHAYHARLVSDSDASFTNKLGILLREKRFTAVTNICRVSKDVEHEVRQVQLLDPNSALDPKVEQALGFNYNDWQRRLKSSSSSTADMAETNSLKSEPPLRRTTSRTGSGAPRKKRRKQTAAMIDSAAVECIVAGKRPRNSVLDDDATSSAASDSSYTSTVSSLQRSGEIKEKTPKERKSIAKYDFENIVIPPSFATVSGRIETIRYKEVETPNWQLVGDSEPLETQTVIACERLSSSLAEEEDSGNVHDDDDDPMTGVGDSSDEETSDEAFGRRHRSGEMLERQRFNDYVRCSITPRRTRQLPTDVHNCLQALTKNNESAFIASASASESWPRRSFPLQHPP